MPARPPSCAADAETLCLGAGGRFQAEVSWRDFEGRTGSGREARLAPDDLPRPGVAESDDSRLFIFFAEGNWELVVKVLDGCGLNDRFWMFGAATTNVEFRLTVTDTVTGAVKTYVNPLGESAAAQNDVDAFATCGLRWAKVRGSPRLLEARPRLCVFGMPGA